MADGEPDYGPGGYLPERASRRARKIVLRARMGMQWIVGTVIAGVVIVGAGLWWLALSDDPPQAPWTVVGPIDQIDAALAVPELDTLVVTAGRARAFAGLDALGLAWCPASDRVEGDDGKVWTATGRARTADTESLAQHPTLVHDGILYVDATVTAPGPAPDVTGAEPACPRP